MVYQLALQDKDGHIVATQSADGFHAHSTATRKLDADAKRADGSLLGRRGETVRDPSPLEDATCGPDAYEGVRLVMVKTNDEGEQTTVAMIGYLRDPQVVKVQG